MDQSSGTTRHADEDPFLTEVYAVKREVAEQFDYNVARLKRLVDRIRLAPELAAQIAVDDEFHPDNG